MCLLCLASSARSRAEVGIGPPVTAWVPVNSRLIDVVPTIVSPDDPSAVVDASVMATVSARGGVLATLGPYDAQIVNARLGRMAPVAPSTTRRRPTG